MMLFGVVVVVVGGGGGGGVFVFLLVLSLRFVCVLNNNTYES